MAAFESAGIYVFVDLDTFTSTVTQGVNMWTPAMFGAFRFVMDAFQKYDNVAGFFIVGFNLFFSCTMPRLTLLGKRGRQLCGAKHAGDGVRQGES